MNRRIPLKYSAALLALTGLLASCGITPGRTSQSNTEFVLTVSVGPEDTQESVLQQYGGMALSWHPEEGFAILKLSAEEKAKLSGEVSIQAVPNSDLEAPEASGSGIGIWGGGLGAWGGGWNTWGGGWNTWGGGTTSLPVLPAENRLAWSQIRLPQGQAVSKNFGQGVKVAVIDTGLDTAHAMFSGRLAPGTEWRDYVDGDGDTNPKEVSGGSAYGHGTAVAGIILQVAPKAIILPIRVLDQNGVGDVADVVSAIDWAVQKGAKVINLSLGTNVDVPALKTQIDYATGQGIYVIASAGNEGSSTTLTYPAAYAKTGTNAKYLIGVGSTNSNEVTSTFSNKGTALEVLAPGENVYSAYPGSQVVKATGTSFAAPLVAGAIALLQKDTASGNYGNLEKHLLDGGRNNSEGRKVLSVLGGLRKLPDFTKKKALFVVGNTTLNSRDTAVVGLMDKLGYAVTLQEDDSSASSQATGQDIVLISSTVSSSLGAKFRDVAVPVVVWEDNIYGDMKLTGTVDGTDYKSLDGITQITISSSTHPMAAGLTGTMSVFSSADSMAAGKPNSNAVKVATITTNTGFTALFGYEKGVSMVGMTAPARRVGLPLFDTGAGKYTAQGAQLFDAAVTWAVSGN